MHEGMLPVKLFECIRKLFIFTQYPRKVGIDPDISFPDKFKLSKRVRYPKLLERVPVIHFEARATAVTSPLLPPSHTIPSQSHTAESGGPPVQLQPLTVVRSHRFVDAQRSHRALS